jgi:hypothetical protein
MLRALAAVPALAIVTVAPVAYGEEAAPSSEAPQAAAPQAAAPQAAAPQAPALLYYPESPRPLAWRAGVGLLLDVLPMRVVESEQRQIPELTGELRVGLPARFAADLRVRAVVIQNQLELGVSWSFPVSVLSFALRNHLGPWFGFVGVEGFDASAWGLMETPGVSVGVPWRDVRFTLTGEAIITFAQHTTLGDATRTSRQGATFSGTATTFTVETLLDNGGVPFFGVGVLWTQPDYQAWLAFSDERARIVYPRFLGGYAF